MSLPTIYIPTQDECMPTVGEDNDPDIANPGSRADTNLDNTSQGEHMTTQSDILIPTDQTTATPEPGTVPQLSGEGGHKEDDPLSDAVAIDDRLAEDKANGSSLAEGGECLSLETGADGEGECVNGGAQDGEGDSAHTEMEVSLEIGNGRMGLTQEEELQRRWSKIV